MRSCPGFVIEPVGASGLKPLSGTFLAQDLRTFLRWRPHFPKATSHPSPAIPQDHPNAGNETPRPQIQDAGRTGLVRGGEWGRERQHHAQAGADVRHPQAAGDPGNRHHRRRRRRGSLRRFRISALAGRQLPAGPGRHLRLAVADPPLRTSHRRHHRGSHPQPQGGRTLFRAAQGQYAQLRGSGEVQAQGQLRQSDAAVSGRAVPARTRGPDPKGPFCAGHRHRRADRQGPARPDRGAAAHRQDRADAEHRALDHRQPSGVLPDRAADRRTSGRSHRHAALGEGRSRVVHLRRAGGAPRPGRRDGDREGEAAGRAWPRRGDPARLRSPGSAAPTTPWCRPRARC